MVAVNEIAPLIYDLTIMLGLAGIVVFIFQRIHQPVVLGYLVAGVILGPYTPPHALVNDISNIKILSELGVIFLMFSLGLEFSFQKLTRVSFSASVTGLIEVLLMVMIGYGTGLFLGWSYYDSLFLGAALSIPSTTIIIKAMDELGLKTKRFAELVFGVLIVEDLLAILLLAALTTIVRTKNIFSTEMISADIQLILVVCGWFIIGYFAVPPLFRKIAKHLNQETLTIISVASCLFLVCIAAKFHYSEALGAFIMGSILAETVLVHRIENLIRPIRDIFAAVFFISVGMLIDPRMIVEHWPTVMLIALVTIVGQITTTTVAAFLTGQSINTSVRVGFSMAQVGEFSFIIAALGLSLHVTSDELYPIIVAVAGITTFTTPYLIRLSGRIDEAITIHLSERMRLFLESYSAWVFRILSSSQKKPLYRSVIIRLIINGIIVAIIFSIIHYQSIHALGFLFRGSGLVNFSWLLLALLISSPFIWGMLFSIKKIQLPDYVKSTFNPAVFIVWFVTLSEIMILSIIYYYTWITLFVFIAVGVVFFFIAYKRLGQSYHWFEKQLIRNIKTDAGGKIRYAELAPWETHLVEIEVGEQSHFIGKSLGESQIRQLYGVNIVAISHGSRIIPAPRGEEKIISHDKLIVLGNDKQIEAFKKQIEVVGDEIESGSFLENFTLKSFLLEMNHPLVGRTIRQSKLREQINGLVVGLERDNKRILNPDPDTVLQTDDLLLVVGEVEKMSYL